MIGPAAAPQIVTNSVISRQDYKKRRSRTGRIQTKDIDKPDTVEQILGIPEEKGAIQTKEALKVIREKLKKQEKEAWAETTKNVLKQAHED